MVRIGEHWEPPHRKPLLMSVHALADRLNVPLSRAYGLSSSIGRLYYGEGASHIRVLVSRVDEFVELTQSGMSVDSAMRVLQRNYGDPPPRPRPTRTPYAFYYGRRRRRRRQF
jgi:hypothetical protein